MSSCDSATSPRLIETLCVNCGLCCNGALFADVELQPADSAAPLREHGLKFRTRRAGKTPVKFLQPCAAFDGCRCQVYELRPLMCRKFECHLLQRAQHGEVKPASALATIQSTRQRIEKVEAFLTTLGENSTDRPVGWRFQKCLRAAERGNWDEAKLETLAELLLAMHQLNGVLQREFLP